MLTRPLRFSAARSYSGANFLQYPHLCSDVMSSASRGALEEGLKAETMYQGATKAATVSFSEPRTAFLNVLPFSCFTCFELKMAAEDTSARARALSSRVDVIFLLWS